MYQNITCVGDVLVFKCVLATYPDWELMWRVTTRPGRHFNSIYNTLSVQSERTFLANGIETMLDEIGSDSIVSSIYLTVTTELVGTMARLECGTLYNGSRVQDAENVTFDEGIIIW